MGLINGKIFFSLLLIFVLFGCDNNIYKNSTKDLYTLERVINDYSAGKRFELKPFYGSDRWFNTDQLIDEIGSMTFYNSKGGLKNGKADYEFTDYGYLENTNCLAQFQLKNGKINGVLNIYEEHEIDSQEDWFKHRKYKSKVYNILYSANYVNGTLSGNRKIYKDELVCESTNYYYNNPHGKSYQYDAVGRVIAFSNYRFGIKEKSIAYFKNGNIKSIELFSDDHLTYKELYNSFGKLVEKSTFTELRQDTEYWNDIKRKYVKYSIVDDCYVGKEIFLFDENGDKEYEINLPSRKNEMLQLKHFSDNISLSFVIKIDLKDYPVQELAKEDSDYRDVWDYKNMEFRQFYKGKLMGKCNLKNNIIDGVINHNLLERLDAEDPYRALSVTDFEVLWEEMKERNEGKANLIISVSNIDGIKALLNVLPFE
jgi:antitoxin component YwqK of YwqJK toxin-antitoxin module